MPEIKVKIDTTTHEKLKKFAKDDRRSLTQYIIIGLEYLANIPNGYHKTPIDALIQSQSQSLTLEQLKEAGIKDFKFNKPDQTSTPEEEKLQQLKTQQQLDKIKEQRTRFLKQKADEILDFLPDYLVDNDQEAIDFILNAYPTNDEIITYLNKVKNGEASANPLQYVYESDINSREQRLLLPVDQNETYQKIKTYALKNELTDQLYHLLEYPHFDLETIPQEIEDELLRPALGSPLDYEYDKLELDELTKCLSWQE